MIAQARKVFSFTFMRHVSAKGYLILTIVIPVALLLLIPIIMGLISNSESETHEGPAADLAVVVDCPGSESVDWSFISESYPGLRTVKAPDLDSARAEAEKDPLSLIVVFEEEEGRISVNTLLPPGSMLDMESAEGFTAVLAAVLPASASENPEESLNAINSEVEIRVERRETSETDSLRKGMAFAVSYVIIMGMYFILLAYGQNTAAALVLEKSSKIMDAFLVSVHPMSVVMGKVAATVAAALLQVFIWIAGAAGGFAIGMARAGRAGVMGGFLTMFRSMFTPQSVILALLIAAVGVLLYCSVSAFGGALASRAEDLSSTNSIFTLVLIASFMVTLFTGTLTGVGEAPSWTYYVPFTAVFTAPGAILLGNISFLQGLISLLICVAVTVAVLYVSSRAYVMMVFYKGKVPNPKEVLAMIFGGRASVGN